MFDVGHDLANELGEGGAIAGAQEREGVFLDEGGPVRRRGVEGVEEGFLDPRGDFVRTEF